MRLSEAVAVAPRIELRVSGARGAASTVPGPAGDVARAANRAALAAIVGAAAGMARQLTESGREGMFVFEGANLAAEVANDVAQQGIYVPPAAADGSTGAWVRKFSGFVDVRWFGAKGDGVTDDTAAFAAAFYAGSWVYAPRGTYVVSQISIGGGKALVTDGHATVIRQKAGTGPDTPIIVIVGSNVNIGSFRAIGNLNGGGADTTGEQNHVILIKATAALGNFSNITIGDIVGENIRGDILVTYSTESATISHVRVGHLYGTNIYRCVAAICTGNGVQIASVGGTQVGYLVFDAEPDGSCAPVVGLRVGYIKGRYAGFIGTDIYTTVDGVYVGTLDLDPAHGGGVGSTPAYPFAAGLIDGVLVRNCKSLTLGKFKANGFNGAALRHIFSGGEIATQPIHIEAAELTDNCKTEGTLLTYFAGAAGVTRLTIGHLKIAITRATVSGIRACYGAKIGPVDAALAADTRLLHACNDNETGPIFTSTTATGYIALSCDGAKIKAGNLNVEFALSYCANARIAGGTVTTPGAPFDGDGSDSHSYPFVEDSVINGSRQTGFYQKIILYRDGHVLASAYHNSSGDKVVGARGAAVADPAAITSSDAANSAAAPTKAEFDALVLRFNQLRADFTSERTATVALLARLRAATGHGLIA